MTRVLPERSAPLLARTAESLYWAGRYLERAEDMARVVSVHGETHIDLPVGTDVGWFPLLDIAGSADLFAEQVPYLDVAAGRNGAIGSDGSPGPSTEDRVTGFVLFDRGNPSSVVSSVFNARSNLRETRPVVPREVWELCNELWTLLRDGEVAVRTRDERVRWLRTVVDRCHQINGVLLGTMRRDESLSFLRLGQQVERASITCRVLAVRADSLAGGAGNDPYLEAHHMAILRSLASYQPLRRAAVSGEDARTSVLFLLRDPCLPRSVSACVAEMRDLVKDLPRNEAALERCADASVAVVAAPILELDPAGLRAHLLDLQSIIGELHHQIAESYFASTRGSSVPTVPLPDVAAPLRPVVPRSTDTPSGEGTIRGVDRASMGGSVGMRCRVRHLTTYVYDAPVLHAYNEAHLRPRDDGGQRCLSHHLEVVPAPAARTETVDPFGNRVTVFSVEGGFTHLSVEATSDVVTSTPPAPPSGPPWESVRVMLDIDRQPAARDARRHRAPSRLVPTGEPFRAYATESFLPAQPMVDAVLDLASRIYRDFVYEPGVTTITTPLLEVYENRRGVCQDFAHFMIACVRSLGLAARYVSGYIPTVRPPEDDALVGGGDASHAWASVYLPGWGWIDVDPTNDQLVGSTHVTTAWGRDYWDVSPLRGSVEGGGRSHRLEVSVQVETVPVEPCLDSLEA